jgi:hypothetical protein
MNPIFEKHKNFLAENNIENPEFEKANRVHDWRNHILQEFQDNWKHLSLNEKKLLVIMAQHHADAEEWD